MRRIPGSRPFPPGASGWPAPLGAPARKGPRRAAIARYGLKPILLCLLCLGGGCEFFSTREFSPKPRDIRALAALLAPGDTMAFRLTDVLETPGDTARVTLAVKTVRFRLLGDTVPQAPSPRPVEMRVLEGKSGTLLESDTLLVQVEGGGLVITGGNARSGGGRYYPLKVAAGDEAASAQSPAAAAGSFLSLPPMFWDGETWIQGAGVLTFLREMEGNDTLEVGGHLEETWIVSETVKEGAHVLAQGRLWYGASGILKGEAIWEGFDKRGIDGSRSGPALSLRRTLTRL